MSDVLFLAHRLPFPPNKGDKLRSYQLLRYMAQAHRVHLGTFVDAADDFAHLQTLRRWCADICAPRLIPGLRKVASLRALASGEPMTLSYYRSGTLKRWIAGTVRANAIERCVVFSSAMAQYVLDMPQLSHLVIDFVDLDSAKWTQYAQRGGPLAPLYRREGAMLLRFERKAAAQAHASLFVTSAEAALFRAAAPEVAANVEVVGNGVDTDYFSPKHRFDSPFPAGVFPLVFTGAMDYWPNIDAARWFATEILPAIRARHPEVCFTIVGMRPSSDVLALAGEHITVTGTVPDVRPFLRHAGIVVAPLRIARGVQNKILEAMAMGCPVVASATCAPGVEAEAGREFMAAANASEFVERIVELIESAEIRATIGSRARVRVRADYSWPARLSRIGTLIEGRRDDRDVRLACAS